MTSINSKRKPIPLNAENLRLLGGAVRIPGYERIGLPQNILHIGVGGFHRAHQAAYLDDLLHRPGFTSWGLCGIALLPQDKRIYETMQRQDCLYTLVERDKEGDRPRILGSIGNILFAPDDPQGVIEKMAAPETRIVSMTVTEGGYYISQENGEFDATHPDILRDLAHPEAPTCVFGYLAEALALRRERGFGPFTLMSCDNIQSNGNVLKKMFLSYVRLRDVQLAGWIEKNGAFPNSMVDRITPATKDEHIELLRSDFGIKDGWPVVTEPFRQWVIEDTFCAGRPVWEDVGAQITADVLPYEKMKIRLLNASHQILCYIGVLLGYEFVHQTMDDPLIRKLAEKTMDIEVTPLLAEVPGVDLSVYKRTLIERFSNPTIHDQLYRICAEGSVRIPKFVLPSMIEQLDAGGPIRLLAFTVAAWIRYMSGRDENGKTISINDPLESHVRNCLVTSEADPRPVLSLREIFGGVLPESKRFVEEVSSAYRSLVEKGGRAALKEYTAD